MKPLHILQSLLAVRIKFLLCHHCYSNIPGEFLIFIKNSLKQNLECKSRQSIRHDKIRKNVKTLEKCANMGKIAREGEVNIFFGKSLCIKLA